VGLQDSLGNYLAIGQRRQSRGPTLSSGLYYVQSSRFPPILAIIFDSNLTYSPRKANLFWVQVPSSFALMSAIGKNLLFNYWPTSLSTRGAYIRHSVGFSLA